MPSTEFLFLDSATMRKPQHARQQRRRVWILVSIVGLLVAGAALTFTLRPRPQLNLVLVTFDTTRADRIGCYGYEKGRTPALDALAEQGILFEHASTPVPLTLPAHATMLTGLYPPEHGLHVNGRGRLPENLPVLAQILQGKDYDTGAFLGSFTLNSKFG